MLQPMHIQWNSMRTRRRLFGTKSSCQLHLSRRNSRQSINIVCTWNLSIQWGLFGWRSVRSIESCVPQSLWYWFMCRKCTLWRTKPPTSLHMFAWFARKSICWMFTSTWWTTMQKRFKLSDFIDMCKSTVWKSMRQIRCLWSTSNLHSFRHNTDSCNYVQMSTGYNHWFTWSMHTN